MQVLNPFKRLKLKVTIKKCGNIANMGGCGRASATGVLLVMLEALTEVSGSAGVMVTMRPPAWAVMSMNTAIISTPCVRIGWRWWSPRVAVAFSVARCKKWSYNYRTRTKDSPWNYFINKGSKVKMLWYLSTLGTYHYKSIFSFRLIF